MKNFCNFFVLFISILCSCTVADFNTNVAQAQTLSASIGDYSSRIVIDNPTIDGQGLYKAVNIGWRNSDKITIYSKDGTRVGNLIYSGTDGDSAGTFTTENGTVMETGKSYVAIYPASDKPILPNLNLASETVIEQVGANSFKHLASVCSMKSDLFTYTDGVAITFNHQMGILSLRYNKQTIASDNIIVSNPGKVTKINVKISDGDHIRSYTVMVSGNSDNLDHYTTPLLVAPTSISAKVVVTFYTSNGGVFTTTKSPIAPWMAGGHYLATIEGFNTLTNISPSSESDVDSPAYNALLEDESRYYVPPTSFNVDVDMVEDYGLDITSFDEDDSAVLQRAIDYVSQNGGGRITMPKGCYTLAWVYMKSNVHIEIEAGAVIKPTLQKKFQPNVSTEPYWRNYFIFMFDNKSSSDKSYLENMSIVGVGGQFIVDLRGAENNKVRCFQAIMARNMMVANVIVEDDNTVYAAVEFDGKNFDNVIYGPENVVVKNIDNYNSVYGYGLMQMQYGRNIYFKDLYSLGGVTVRLESHLGSYFNTDCIRYIDAIVARDIRCENGHAAVMLSPHFVKNGWVDMRNISAVACESTLLLEGGFVSKTEAANGLTPGWFSSKSVFRDIKGVFSATDAQAHPKHYKDMVSERKHLLPSTSPWVGKPGPSIALIYYGGDYLVDVSLDDITLATDFLQSQLWVDNSGKDKVSY